eukprot:TRINITY_DN10823_c0_g1_i1.p1 TRINITY_DN10823_c0_g1~~TRINITY_DN10823_c0_g1_i1.p1  ORF type:complete len:242 (-),score=64.63 TRINITY_DN10823_c0_g1_i1:22-747(-)
MLGKIVRRSKSKKCVRFIAQNSTPQRIILFGPPGGGKGTQASKMIKDYNFLHVSTGQLLRQSVASQTPVGESVKEYLASGSLVPDNIMNDVAKECLSSLQYSNKNYILDGMPRTVAQAEFLDRMLEEQNQKINFAIFLDVPQEEILERIVNRRVHLNSGRTYHLTYSPPKEEGKDDETGEPLVQREDDTEAKVKERLEQFQKHTTPLLEYYEKKGVLHSIPSPNSGVGYQHIKTVLDPYFK